MQLNLFYRVGLYFGPDEDHTLSMGSKAVWSHIYRMAKKMGFCSPSLAWFGRRLGRSVRQVARYIDELVDAGWLSVTRRRRAPSRFSPTNPADGWATSSEALVEVSCSDISVTDERQLSLFGVLDSNTPTVDANMEQRFRSAKAESAVRACFYRASSWADRNPNVTALSLDETIDHLKIWAEGDGSVRDLADIEDGSGLSAEEFAALLLKLGDTYASVKPKLYDSLPDITEALVFIDTLGWISKPLRADNIRRHIEDRIRAGGLSAAAVFQAIKKAFQLAHYKTHLRPRSWGWFLGVIDNEVARAASH